MDENLLLLQYWSASISDEFFLSYYFATAAKSAAND